MPTTGFVRCPVCAHNRIRLVPFYAHYRIHLVPPLGRLSDAFGAVLGFAGSHYGVRRGGHYGVRYGATNNEYQDFGTHFAPFWGPNIDSTIMYFRFHFRFIYAFGLCFFTQKWSSKALTNNPEIGNTSHLIRSPPEKV